MIDTLKLTQRLEAAGMNRPQAEAIADGLAESLRDGFAQLPVDMAEVKAELRFHRWAFAIVIGLEIALLLRAFWPAGA